MAILNQRNSKKLIKQHLPETIFLSITMISAVTLIVPLSNYIQFYNALYNFSYVIPGVNINTTQLSAHVAQINFIVIATNPTAYSGLQVTSVTCEIDYYGIVGGLTNWWQLTTLYNTKGYPLSADSNITISLNFTVNPSSASPTQFDAFQGFISYLASQVPGGQISWQLACSVVLHSFLVGSSYTLYFTPMTYLS